MNKEKVIQSMVNITNNKRLIKISFLTDANGIPIDVTLNKGNVHDSKIFSNHLPFILNTKEEYKNSIFIADAGYDTKNIKNDLRPIFNKLIIRPNKRNTRREIKLSDSDFKIYLNRVKIEHTNSKLKSYRRLNNIYEGKAENYKSLIYLALSHIILK